MKRTLRAVILTVPQLLCGLALIAGLYLAYGLGVIGLLGFGLGIEERSWPLTLLALLGLLTILLASGACILALWQIICALQSARTAPFRKGDGFRIARWLSVIAAALLPLVLTACSTHLLYVGAAAADILFSFVIVRHFLHSKRGDCHDPC